MLLRSRGPLWWYTTILSDHRLVFTIFYFNFKHQMKRIAKSFQINNYCSNPMNTPLKTFIVNMLFQLTLETRQVRFAFSNDFPRIVMSSGYPLSHVDYAFARQKSRVSVCPAQHGRLVWGRRPNVCRLCRAMESLGPERLSVYRRSPSAELKRRADEAAKERQV